MQSQTDQAAQKGVSKASVIASKPFLILLLPKTPLGTGKLICFPVGTHHVDILPCSFWVACESTSPGFPGSCWPRAAMLFLGSLGLSLESSC